MSGQINVAVDAGPTTDLNQVMTDIRDHYEGVIGKNRKELESWYQNKVRRLKTTLEFGIHLVRTVGRETHCCLSFVPRWPPWSRTSRRTRKFWLQAAQR